MVSETFARRRFGAADPVGRRIRIGPVQQPVAIVGVVGDVRQQSLAQSHPDAVYMTAAQWPFAEQVISLVARGPGDPAVMAPGLRRAVWSVDAHQPVSRVTTLDGLVADSAALRRFALRLFQACGLAALILAAVGIYGVLTGAVAKRAREIGVRAALGPSPGRILALILGHALRLIGVGLGLGMAGAAAAVNGVALVRGVAARPAHLRGGGGGVDPRGHAGVPGSRLASGPGGSPVILVFYPADWSPVCGDQVTLYNEVLPEFERYGARLLGISVDSMWCHRAFSENRNLRFPLLADFEPKGEVARRYGVYHERDGTSERALFVIDAAGVIRWRYVSPLDVNPGADGILAALEAIHAEVTP